MVEQMFVRTPVSDEDVNRIEKEFKGNKGLVLL